MGRVIYIVLPFVGACLVGIGDIEAPHPDGGIGGSTGGQAGATSGDSGPEASTGGAAGLLESGGTAGVAGSGGALTGCGDHIVTPPEECDDGATESGDGCSSDCKVECEGPHLYRSTDNHCFSYSTASLFWTPAESDCVVFGGHLAAITSGAEQEFVTNIIKAEGEQAWIGLNDIAVEGDYQWTNGDKYLFQNWGVGEPNDAGQHAKNCVVVLTDTGSFHWNDYGCNAQHKFICERAVGVP